MSLILLAGAVLVPLITVNMGVDDGGGTHNDADEEYTFIPKQGQNILKFERQYKKSIGEARNQYSNSSDIEVAKYLLNKINSGIAFDKVDMLLKLDIEYKVHFIETEDVDINVKQLKGSGWIPLIPGDVVSYNCIMGGRKDQEHWAIYVGSGYFVHTWWKATTVASQIVHMASANISKKTIRNKGRILCTYVSKFAPVFEKKGYKESCANKYGNYYIIDVDNDIFKKEDLYAIKPQDRVKEALQLATRDTQDTSYHVTTSNCQHFVANIVFKHKPKKGSEHKKCEAISRLLDVPLLRQRNQSGEEYHAYQNNKSKWHAGGSQIIEGRISRMSNDNYFASTVLKLDEDHEIVRADASISST